MTFRTTLVMFLLASTIAAAQGFPPVRKEFPPIQRYNPQYPIKAERAGTAGRVVAQVHVAPNGKVTQVKIVSSTDQMFAREVIRALSEWTYNPERVGFIGEYELVFDPNNIDRSKPPPPMRGMVPL